VRRRDVLALSALAAALPLARRVCAVAPRNAARVAVVGGGFGGSAAALALRRLDPTLDVTLVDPDDTYATCPGSNEVLVGLRSLRSLDVSRDGLRRAGVARRRDTVVAIDADRNALRLAGGDVLPYDRCVVAPGIRFLWDAIEGYDEAAAEFMPHAWKAGAQTARLAALLRNVRPGGVVAIGVPSGLMRCPPGPYERATLVAGFLRRHAPRAKVLILDSNNHFPRQDVFTAIWHERYRGLVEWVSPIDGGAIVGVEAKRGIVRTSRGEQRVDVANVIPPQAAGHIALDSGLATGHGWCPVNPVTFESRHRPRVHVIGDACIADAMPKAASAAVSQAHQCAAAIVALLGGRAPPAPALDSVCYSLTGRDRAIAIHGRFAVENGAIRSTPSDDAGVSDDSESAARDARAWYRTIVADAFG
jgi:sulfide dehydrogenase [flavocytochrome c] flavoprotein subunit